MDNPLIEILLILLLTLANGFFAAAEIAIVSAKRGRLEGLAQEGSSAAKQAIKLADDPNRFLATVQIGITLIGTFSAAFGGAKLAEALEKAFVTIPALADSAETLALLLVVLLITYLSLVIGELTPKRLALRRAETIALIAAPVMTALQIVARPLIGLLTISVSGIARLFGDHGEAKDLMTSDDIVYVIREGEEAGAVTAADAELIRRVLHFADLPVRAIMTPRPEAIMLDAAAPLLEIAARFRATGISRMPVYDGDANNIIGILNAKALLTALDENEPFDLRAALLPPVFVVETQRISETLARFRRDGIHMGLVIDEFGQVAGLVTLEDMLEELVGDIRDEYDDALEEAFVQRSDGSWLVDGGEPYEKVALRVGLPDLPEDEPRHFTSLAGLIIEKLHRIPATGDKIEVDGFTLEVVDMDHMRVDRVLITREKKDSGSANQPTSPP